MLMMNSLYFDYCALAILVILVISIFSRHMTRGRINRYFFFLLVLSLVTTLADITSVMLDIFGSDNIAFKYAMHTIYLITHSFATPLYTLYIVALTDTWHIVRKHAFFSILFFVPFSLIAVLSFGNLFIHNLFYFNSNNIYTRGPLFFVLYLTAAFYFVCALLYLMHYSPLFSRGHYASLISIFPLMLAATAIQMVRPDILIEMFFNAVSLLYICVMIQRPEDFLDPDTGLQSSSSYVHDMNRSLKTKKQNRIIMINITNYTVIRKMLGYENNLILLHKMAEQLRRLNGSMLLNSDLYYLGAGKFRVVVGSCSFEKIPEAAEKINRAMKPNMTINQMEVNMTACVCIADFPKDIPDTQSLMTFGNDLDSRYYSGNVLLASDIYQQSRYEIMKDIDSIIEYALANKQFEVYYQPIYSVAKKAFTTAEALLRLHTKEGSFVSPDIFIPAAEKSGAIHKIGAYVLEEVCAFIASEEYKKLNFNYIEVNLSIAQCMQKGLAEEVLSTVRKYEIDASQINLEITETAASYSQNTMMDNLNILAEAGISLSLDDFGTGYSNMMRIASLPLHIVKLDKTFSDIAENSNMTIVLENTIRMIKELNMQIVVEGIETKDLAEKFSRLNCEFIQGFYYSKPLPKKQLIAFLADTQASA